MYNGNQLSIKHEIDSLTIRIGISDGWTNLRVEDMLVLVGHRDAPWEVTESIVHNTSNERVLK